MTTEFLEGDLVEAVKGEERHAGRLGKQPGGLVLRILFFELDACPYISFLERDGFTLTLIERPKPKVELPTEVGVYAQPYENDRDDEWHTDNLAFFYLNTGGNWADIGWGQPDSTAPFTRLESRADTAKAVIDWLEKAYDNAYTLRQAFDETREHFGVADA